MARFTTAEIVLNLTGAREKKGRSEFYSRSAFLSLRAVKSKELELELSFVRRHALVVIFYKAQ